jgi:hypothetical protein
LRISYDSSGYAGENIISDSVSSNVVFTSIVDLGETNEVEFRVPYQQATAFLTNRNNYHGNALPWSNSLAPSFLYNGTLDNGTITVRVQTILTAPIAVSSVSILVFVRAADNFEVANPRNPPQLSPFMVQSDEFTETDNTSISKIAGTGIPNTHDQRYLMNFGESVKSLRQLMRRTNLSTVSTWITVPGSDYNINYKIFTKIPPTYGYDPTGIHLAKGLVVPVSTFPFNYVSVNPITWFMPAFVAYRGSTFWSFNTVDNTPIGHVRVTRQNQQTYATALENQTSTFAKGTYSNNASIFNFVLDQGGAGQALTSQYTNAGLVISCPMYAKYRFQSTKPQNATLPSTVDDSALDMFRFEVTTEGLTGPTSQGLVVYSYVSIGTDFGLHFFLNVPTLWIYSLYPTPV